MTTLEEYWRHVELAESDLKRLRGLGGEADPNWPMLVTAVETLRANVKELQRVERAKRADAASESMFWRPKGEKPQEDAPWLKDGWSRR
jgi:hypothetical protein